MGRSRFPQFSAAYAAAVSVHDGLSKTSGSSEGVSGCEQVEYALPFSLNPAERLPRVPAGG